MKHKKGKNMLFVVITMKREMSVLTNDSKKEKAGKTEKFYDVNVMRVTRQKKKF